MTREMFEKLVSEMEIELAPHGITVHVAEDLNPFQLASQFYKNNNHGAIQFKRGNAIVDFHEYGQMNCFLNESWQYNSDKEKCSFEEYTGIHTDDELADLADDILYESSNWFNICCYHEGDCGVEPLDDVIGSLEEILDSSRVIGLFKNIK